MLYSLTPTHNGLVNHYPISSLRIRPPIIRKMIEVSNKFLSNCSRQTLVAQPTQVRKFLALLKVLRANSNRNGKLNKTIVV